MQIEGEKIRKLLFNEISLFTGIIAIILSIVFWVQNPIRNIELGDIKIKADIVQLQKDLKNQEIDINVRLVQMQIQLDRVEGRQIEVLQSLARLEAQHK